MKHKIAIQYEHLSRFDFFPCYAHICRDGVEIKKFFFDMCSDRNLSNPQELIRRLRRQVRENDANCKLAVSDEYNNFYRLKYRRTYKNIVEEYKDMKRLKEYLESGQGQCIVMSTEHGEKEYKNHYKIVYAPLVVEQIYY